MPHFQTTLTLPAKARGVHLITQDINDAVNQLLANASHENAVGLMHLFLQHTSAGLAINENADPDVRLDLNDWLDKIAPENQPEYRHTLEGSDDLPAHFKSVMLGVSLTIPLTNGRLGLGIWQGIYLCEFRNHASGRKLVITVSI